LPNSFLFLRLWAAMRLRDTRETVCGGTVMVRVTIPDPVPEVGLTTATACPTLKLLTAFQVTPGAASRLIVPETLPPAQPPIDPREMDGVTQSVTPPVEMLPRVELPPATPPTPQVTVEL
jgi:hypothetical protein